MAGIIDSGISGFIGNNVKIFKNAITIDIFGNVFYRNYSFGASDDVGVFWNTKNSFSKNIMLFLSVSLQKSLNNKFDYGNKLRASKTYDIRIFLPTYHYFESLQENEESNHSDTPNYHKIKTYHIAFDFMENFIGAIEKTTIENVALWSQKRLEATRHIVENPRN